ncbi:uncharacterized protein LOC135824453 isoform X3 [Sycon ciliatum]|uniref:uncharacterized protein LOC135824453 isoform X3 n=1 Tax=Sycon ciliatum TaxID=27933 RepID=UPI0031F6286A
MKESSVLSSPDSPGSSRPGNGASSGPQNNAITLALSCPDTTSSNTEGGDGGDGNTHVGGSGHGLSNSSNSNSSQTPVQIVPNEVKQTGTASEAGATGTEMESQLTRPASSSRSSPPVQAVAAASPAKDADTAADTAAAAAPVRRSQRASMPQLSGRNGADQVGGNVTGCVSGAAAGGGGGTGSLRGSPSVLRPHSVSLAAAASAAVLDGAREQDEQPRTPTASKRRTRPPSGEGRRRSLPLVHSPHVRASSLATGSPRITGNRLSHNGGTTNSSSSPGVAHCANNLVPALAAATAGVSQSTSSPALKPRVTPKATALDGESECECTSFRGLNPVHQRSSSYGNTGPVDSPKAVLKGSSSADDVVVVVADQLQGRAGAASEREKTKFETASTAHPATTSNSESSTECSPNSRRRKESNSLATISGASAAAKTSSLDAKVRSRHQLGGSAGGGLFAQRRQRSLSAQYSPSSSGGGGSPALSCSPSRGDSRRHSTNAPGLHTLARTAATTLALQHRDGVDESTPISATVSSSARQSAQSTGTNCLASEERRTKSSRNGVGEDDGLQTTADREALYKAIAEYNQRRQQLGIFKIQLCPSLEGVHYEGALRFYYTSPSGQETAKVVRVQNTTSALDLVPLLLPKFSTCIDERLRSHPGHFYLAIVDRHGEHRLEDDEYPLQISFRSAADAPHRYLLRQTDPVECTAATGSAAVTAAASAAGGGGGGGGDHLDQLSSATALSTVGRESTASLLTTATTTTTPVASSAIASNVVTAAKTTSQDSLDTDSTLFTSSGEGVLVPRPGTTTTSAALAQHRQSLSVEREQVAATMSTLSVMPSSLPLSSSPVGRRPLSLSQSSINADSVSDSSSSVDHHAGIMPGDNAGGAYTGTTGTSMQSPGHATTSSTSSTTPRRLIQTLRRNMRRQSSAGNRRSWHGDEERRRSSASAVNSIRVYTGPGLQEQSASDYKTVFASDDTVARDVIESVLQRLFIYDQSCDDFVLYETIGALEWYHCVSGDIIEYNDGVADWANVAQRFTPRYSRLVAPNEYPQVLMRLWQVDMGSERRMYVHHRNAVPQYRLSSGTPSRSSSPQAQQQPAEDSGRAVTPQLTYVQRFCDSPSKLQFTGVYTDNLCTPFLVTLSCSQPEKNLLVYPLIDKVTSIGQLATGTSVSIALAGYDLLPLHCTIRCTEVSRNSSSSLNAAKMQDRRDIFSLDAAKEAHVAVNGAPVSGMLVLRDGDLLHLATSHVFVFRDPSQPLSLSNGWKWLPQPDFTSAAGSLSTTTDITSGSMHTASLADDPSSQTSEATPSTSSSQRSARVITTSSSSASSRKSVSLSTVSIGSDPQHQQGGSTPSSPSDSLTRTMPLVFSGIQQEDVFVQLTLTTADVSSLPNPLSPSAAIILALVRFNPATTATAGAEQDAVAASGKSSLSTARKQYLKRFLGKACEALQGVVWQTAAILDDHKAHLTLDTDPMHLLNTMSHDLQELSAWMANVLEIANCARRLLRNLGVNPASASTNASLSSLSGGTALDSAEAALDQELSESLTALQDIVIYAFQQVLYPVTKLLYMVLPAVLDENPFEFMHRGTGDSGDQKATSISGSKSHGHGFTASHSTSSDSGLGRSVSGSDHSSMSDIDSTSPTGKRGSGASAGAGGGDCGSDGGGNDSKHNDGRSTTTSAAHKDSQVKRLTDILQLVLDLLGQSQLHPNITLQLLSNIFFFTNASLFNTLMDEGAGDRFYRWNKGIQIRTNLDILETWASQQGVTKEAIRHLQQLSAAADLLASPKQALLQTSWSQLRAEHKSLTPAQLHRLLQHYQLGANHRRPIGWLPLSSEMASAQDVDDVLVSFASHPPLRIPTGNYIFSLQSVPPVVGITDFMASLCRQMADAGYPLSKDSGRSLSTSKTDLDSNLPVSSSPTNVTSSSGDESRRPVAIVSPQLPSPQSGGGTSSLSTSVESTAKTTVLDDVCLEDVDSASYGLAAIAEADEEDGTPQVLRRHRRQQPASTGSKEDQQSRGAASATSPAGTTANPSSGGDVDSTTATAGNAPAAAAGSVVVTAGASRGRWSSPPSSLTTSPTSTLNRNISRSTQALHSELVDTDSTDEFVVVNLKKTDSGSIGMGLIDGTLMGAAPGLYISSLVPGYPAAESGKLREGDKLLAINSCNLSRASQSQAYDVLKSTSRRVTILAIRDAAAAEMIVASSC